MGSLCKLPKFEAVVKQPLLESEDNYGIWDRETVLLYSLFIFWAPSSLTEKKNYDCFWLGSCLLAAVWYVSINPLLDNLSVVFLFLMALELITFKRGLVYLDPEIACDFVERCSENVCTQSLEGFLSWL